MRRRNCFWCKAGLAVALCASFVPTLWAATPREELLRYVPDDVAFCLVIQDLRGHAADLAASPFVKSLKGMPLAAGLAASPEMQKLRDADQFLQSTFHVDAAKLRDEILGDAVVLAYRPGPAGRPEAEQGLILLRARDGKLLAELIERINVLQRQSEDLVELKEETYHDVAYFRRVERKRADNKEERKESNYYVLRGPVLLFASHETMLRDAIDRGRAKTTDKEPAIAKQFRLAHAEKDLAALWINPRAFEKEMATKAEGAPQAEKLILKTVAAYWKALDGIVLSADLQKDLEVKITVRARVEELPAPARKFLAESAKRSEFWDRFPREAMLAVASRFDLPALVEMVQMFLPPEARQSLKDAVDRGFGAALGPDLGTDVLPWVGPDWGLYIVAPASEDKEWFPQSAFAVRLRPGDKKRPADRIVLDALNLLAGVAVLSHNSQSGEALRLKTVAQDKTEVRYFVGGDLPAGLHRESALNNGYLVLGSSPEAIRRLHAVSPPDKDRAAAADVVPLLRMSFKEIRRFVQERREPLARMAAEKNKINQEDAAKKLDGLLAVLKLVDGLELSQRAEAGQATFTLRVQTAQPLK